MNFTKIKGVLVKSGYDHIYTYRQIYIHIYIGIYISRDFLSERSIPYINGYISGTIKDTKFINPALKSRKIELANSDLKNYLTSFL